VAAPLAGLALAAALVAGARAGRAGVYAVWFSTWLAVEDVDVSGAETVEASDIRTRSGIDVGEPMIGVDLDTAERRIGALAVVRSVSVTRQWPHGILVSIEERTPIAVVEIGDRLRGMDEDGVVFRDYKTAPPGLPRVVTTSGTTSDALKEAAEVVSALPQELTLIVDHVQVSSVDKISLVLKDGREVIWGSADESATKAEVLATLLATVQARSTTSRARQADHPLTRRAVREQSTGDAPACRRNSGPRPYCHRHGEVDITITLSLRVTVEPERRRRDSVAAAQNYLAIIKVVGIGGGGVNAVNRMIEVGSRASSSSRSTPTPRPCS
jgi:cell division protein FtsQ